MDQVKELLKKVFHFRPTFQRTISPPPAKSLDVVVEEDYREDEVAFVVGLENGEI